MFLKILSFFLPWQLRRKALNKWFGFQIDAKAHIGMAWIFPKKLVMARGATIGHFSVAIHLDLIEMETNAGIGRSNWITGFTTAGDSLHFQHQTERRPELIVRESANITKNHHFDCTSRIEIGRFTTVAGYQSQFLTHSIDVMENRQDSKPITIGEYCFIGTNVVVLGGASLPSRSVLGAKSLLNKDYKEPWKLYAGVPAKMLADIPPSAKYFNRKDGYVY